MRDEGLLGDCYVLGIAICAYNRSAAVAELIESLRTLTETDFSIVVCDDGSSDNTVSVCDGLGIPVVTGVNRGVAQNKNRGLHWLMTRTDATHMLIIEDDMIAIEQGWERHWIAAIDRWGHANWADKAYMSAKPDRVLSGDGSVENPFLAKLLTGCLMAFSRSGLEKVGYFDPRFGTYGYEHLDMSRRFRRASMGIETKADEAGRLDEFYVSIAGGMKMKTLASPSDKARTDHNKNLYEQILREPVYRGAWLNEVGQAVLETEIEVAARHWRG